jgi:hypothetical protein
MVPKSRDTREEGAYYQSLENNSQPSFAAVLEEKASQQKEATPSLNCHTYTYGANRRINHFLYQPKEYTY